MNHRWSAASALTATALAVLLISAIAGCARPPAAPATTAPPPLAPLEALALEAPTIASPISCCTPPLSAEVRAALQDLAAHQRRDHLPYLVEYGLRLHGKMLQETRLARRVPVDDNVMLAELIRLTGIPEVRTAHEGGWLDRQFYGKPEFKRWWSSYQVYVWVKENSTSVLEFPNARRIMALMDEIDRSGRGVLGGGGVCHYGCQ